MKKPTKSQLLATAAIAIGLVGVSAGAIQAASDTRASTNPMTNLVSAIAQKFNLNTADVQQVFDQQHAQMEAGRVASFKARLAEIVAAGKLTQEQADKLIAKQAELAAARESQKDSFSTMTETERRTAVEAQRTALEQWATDNNIPQEYLRFAVGHGGKGPHRGEGFGPHGAPLAPIKN